MSNRYKRYTFLLIRHYFVRIPNFVRIQKWFSGDFVFYGGITGVSLFLLRG